MASNFDFVGAGWPEIAVEARKAEGYANGDPRSSLFYARRAVELTVDDPGGMDLQRAFDRSTDRKKTQVERSK